MLVLALSTAIALAIGEGSERTLCGPGGGALGAGEALEDTCCYATDFVFIGFVEGSDGL